MKTVYNYAIVRSVFGDLWIGKTKLKSDEKSIFSKKEDAINHAQDLFCSENPDFDCWADSDCDNYDCDLDCQYNEIEENAGEEVINKKLEIRIVRK